MTAIKYSPYIPNIDAWVEFFKNQPLEYKSFYTIGKTKQEGEDMEAVKLVSPTQSAVEQAKSALKRELDIDQHFPILKRSRKSYNSQSKSRKK